MTLTAGERNTTWHLRGRRLVGFVSIGFNLCSCSALVLKGFGRPRDRILWCTLRWNRELFSNGRGSFINGLFAQVPHFNPLSSFYIFPEVICIPEFVIHTNVSKEASGDPLLNIWRDAQIDFGSITDNTYKASRVACQSFVVPLVMYDQCTQGSISTSIQGYVLRLLN